MLVPAVGRRLPNWRASPGQRAETARALWRFCEAVAARCLRAMAPDGPVVVLLATCTGPTGRPCSCCDVVRRCESVPLLVLGTYRDTDLVRTHPMAETLTDLRRAPNSSSGSRCVACPSRMWRHG